MSDDAGSERSPDVSGERDGPEGHAAPGSDANDCPDGPDDDASPEGAEAPDDPDDDAPRFPEDDVVSDGREKYVTVLLPDGETVEHGGVYFQHTASTFAVSDEPDFPDAETTRYEKTDVVRVTVKQHHSACFVTTAVAGESRTLDELRAFRDEALASTAPGGALVALYERISPPVARSLACHPSATPTRAVRRLVRLCARLARRHRTASGPRRPALAIVLVALYVVGLALGAASHAYFVFSERGGGPAER